MCVGGPLLGVVCHFFVILEENGVNVLSRHVDGYVKSREQQEKHGEP
jgi:hypothetical protein